MILTFTTVVCLTGLHEVARELENPFRNAPNDIPLCTLLAMYNESLVTMCSGFHPDAYWDPDRHVNSNSLSATRLFPPVNNNNKSPPQPQQQDDNKHLKELELMVQQQAKELQNLKNIISKSELH